MNDNILEELRRIKGNDLIIDPERIVDFARNPDTALHSKFEWDNTVAGHEYRLWQARQVCRAFVTVLDTGESKEPIRMFVNIKTDDGERGYAKTENVLDDEDARRELVLGQLTRLHNIYKNYPLPELKPVGRAIHRCRLAMGVPAIEAAE